MDAFHHRLLKAMNVKWPQKISTELYRKTRVRKWSETIKTCRISWYGHALRLPKNTTAQIALTESEGKLKKYLGQITTWLQLVKRNLEELNVDPGAAKETAHDKDTEKNCGQNEGTMSRHCVRHSSSSSTGSNR